MNVTKPALRYHGAKFRIAAWVMAHFPPHVVYVEAFGGGAGVLLQKPRSYAEVYNDLDGDVVNFFRVLRDPEKRARLMRDLAMTPYAREEFEAAYEPTDDDVELARRLLIRAQMGFGSAGATRGTTGFRSDSRRVGGTASEIWLEQPDRIAAAGRRFQGVIIENRPAIDVMQQHDDVDTLHFVDPPYVHDTRVLRSRHGNGKYGEYRHEMTDEDHLELIEALKQLRGYVVLCGYPNRIYDEALTGWRTSSTTARISAGRGGSTRTEVIWMNPACQAAIDGNAGALFEVA